MAMVDLVVDTRYEGDVRIGGDGTRRVAVCALLGLCGAALYVSAPVELVIGDLDRSVSFVSELSARDQPHHVLFQSFDVVAGVFFVALGVGLGRVGWWGRGRAGAGWRWGCRSVVGFGLATVTAACLPLDCAASASRTCELREGSGQVSAVHQAHSAASALSTLAVIAGLVLLGWSSRSRPGWRPATWAAALALPVISVLSAVLALLGLGWGLGDSETTGGHLRAVLGIAQRTEILVVSGWIGVLSACLLRAAATGPWPAAAARAPAGT